MSGMIEGTKKANDDVISRLHGIIRPFVLRRLKKDVETQLPGKFEHIVKCQLSRRQVRIVVKNVPAISSLTVQFQMFIYEEYMARSSTRQAFKKGGGNFMGMMNVLMQLRKVCNHPDLFEPRSVITSFMLQPVICDVPSDIRKMIGSADPLLCVSESLLRPLWCGSCGVPALENAMRHDGAESDELLLLEDRIDPQQEIPDSEINYSAEEYHPALIYLMNTMRESSKRRRRQKALFQGEINTKRCAAKSFLYNARLVENVCLNLHGERKQGDAMNAPSAFLAAMRSQEDIAASMSETIKRFVFAVPKAGASPPTIQSNGCVELDAEEREQFAILSVALQDEVLTPFNEAYARLTSFFPDKKLVQFDAGKLQTLATLLRERKSGGHRVLIFTQMSKMLDILETFLNLNGHTYLRLDGGTSVDRRQRLMDRFNNDDKIFCMILSTRSGGTGVNLIGADTVIFYDSDWNPAQDAQVSAGRYVLRSMY
jgi:SNF2 family DNA or RNA helicase